MSRTELVQRFNVCIDPWKWMSIVTAIPREWKSKIKKEKLLQEKLASLINNDTYIIINNRYKLAKLVTSKEIYQKLIVEKIEPPTSIEKWINIFPFMENIDWSKIFSLSFRTIREPHFHSFQYKVLNRILNCKDKLFTWKKTDNNICVYCNDVASSLLLCRMRKFLE